MNKENMSTLNEGQIEVLDYLSTNFNIYNLKDIKNLLEIIKSNFYLTENPSKEVSLKTFAILDKAVADINAAEEKIIKQQGVCQLNSEFETDEDFSEYFYRKLCSVRLRDNKPFLLINAPEEFELNRGCN